MRADGVLVCGHCHTTKESVHYLQGRQRLATKVWCLCMCQAKEAFNKARLEKERRLLAEEYRKAAGRYGDGSDMQRKRPFFSFWDPAVRCPPKWGSGGDVDVLNQWVYAVPEPMNVAGPAEEIIAMAASPLIFAFCPVRSSRTALKTVIGSTSSISLESRSTVAMAIAPKAT